MIGTRLGPYEITARLGEGGMGEVWRAHDSKLKRDVAIKVLPAAFVADPERLARFEREAQLLAQLNHPNIAQIFGMEASGESHALVMELVEGPTLADRLAQGGLPLDEALSLAKQIAEALEEAHEKGIVHRDLKPQNLKASIEGKIKVLDFGLAKAMDASAGSASGGVGVGGAVGVGGGGGGGDLLRSPTMMNSPTLTAAHGTQLGVILGTAAYMAPEQARGGMVDKRADIWAFGVVFFEMLTGTRLFAGETVSDTLAAVLRAEIDWAALPAATPASIRTLLRRCLERKPKHRLHDIADARIVIDEVLAGRSDSPDAAVAAPAPAAVAPVWRRALPWTLAAIGLVAALVALSTGRSPAPAPPLFVDLGAPGEERFQFQGDFGAPATLSRDGSKLAFGAVGADSRTRLWVRSLATGEEKRIDGTEGATAPFFSFDGASLGYFANARLMVVSLAGGRPYEVADAPNGRGGAWTPDGTIVYAPDFRSGLFRIPATGGRPEPLTRIDAVRHSTHRWPALVPDGRAVVYLATNHSADKERESELRWIRLDGADDHALVPSLANGIVAGGELLYLRNRELLARAIDDGGKLGGEPRTVASELLFDPSTWRSTFAATADRLVYARGDAARGTHLSRVDRAGRPLAELAGDDVYYDLRLSPDGQRLAVAKGLRSDIWLLDLERGTQSRFTFDPQLENSAVWSRDGNWIYFTRANDRNIGGELARKAANGTGQAETVFDTESDQIGILATDATPDGRWLLVTTGVFPFTDTADTQWLALDGSRRLFPLLQTPALEVDGRLSPDGRWLAYRSNESGIDQIYVIAAGRPGGGASGAKWQISVDGGRYPVWSRDGREILYLEPSLNLSRVSVEPDGAVGLRFGKPEALFGTTLLADSASFDLAPDGQSLILNHYGEAQSRPLRMILDWRRLLGK